MTCKMSESHPSLDSQVLFESRIFEGPVSAGSQTTENVVGVLSIKPGGEFV